MIVNGSLDIITCLCRWQSSQGLIYPSAFALRFFLHYWALYTSSLFLSTSSYFFPLLPSVFIIRNVVNTASRAKVLIERLRDRILLLFWYPYYFFFLARLKFFFCKSFPFFFFSRLNKTITTQDIVYCQV